MALAESFPEVGDLPAQAALPDPLVMLDGTKVTTKEQWLTQRKPQLKALFQHYMYGYMPAPPPEGVKAKEERVDAKYFGGKATKKEVTIAFGPEGTPAISLLLIVPNERQGPAPVFLGLNFNGNHTVLDDPGIALPTTWMRAGSGVKDNRATDEGRAKASERWPIELAISRGYAVATFYYGDIDPDKPDFTDGVHPHYFKPGQTEPGEHDWGSIAAWAWGLSRAVDYLLTNGDIDGKRIALLGHSRNGKAALLSAAFDERVALVVANQAGCGGSAPSRCHNEKAETVTRINTSFPHWFNDTFTQFNGKEEKLPFDQNCLVALVAPRPVLFTAGEHDQWANPAGQFEVLKSAEPVYTLLGAAGLDADTQPPVGTIIDSNLGYYNRDSKHQIDEHFWKVFLDFADKHLR